MRERIEPATPEPPHTVRKPLSTQTWQDTIFLHWPCDSSTVRPFLPPETELDVADGTAWLGIVAQRMRVSQISAVPVPPLLGRFTELNVRTYCVDKAGRRGIVFLTMEASHPAVVPVRIAGRLPYHWSKVSHSTRGPGYHSARRCPANVGLRFRVRCKGAIDPTPLDHFLTARWRLYSRWYGQTLLTSVEHRRWPLQAAELTDFADDGLLSHLGISIPSRITSVLYSVGVETKVSAPVRLLSDEDRHPGSKYRTRRNRGAGSAGT